MTSTARSILTRITVAVGSLAVIVGSAAAGPTDYRFEVASPPVRTGPTVSFEVRLVRLPDGIPVRDANISAVDFNMNPEGMAESDPILTLPTAEPGVVTLRTEPSMAGRWELILSAQVPGETGEVTGRLVIPVPK